MNLNGIKKLLGDDYLWYFIKNSLTEHVKHPLLTTREITKFFLRYLLEVEEKPKEGLRYENHTHSEYSDGPNLALIVNKLFHNGINIWSLTDHENSYAFDYLLHHKYDLNKNNPLRTDYETESGKDDRYLIIHSGNRELILLRSMEKMTDNGEIGIYCYEGIIPYGNINFKDAIKIATDMGGYVVINHPYIKLGLGYNGFELIEEAVKAGAIGIEKNSTEVPPMMYSHVRAEADIKKLNKKIKTSMLECIAKEHGVQLVPGSDAHYMRWYGLTGMTFNEELYENKLREKSGNHADVVKELVSSGSFDTYFNYLTYEEFFEFLNEK